MNKAIIPIEIHDCEYCNYLLIERFPPTGEKMYHCGKNARLLKVLSPNELFKVPTLNIPDECPYLAKEKDEWGEDE